MMISRLCGFKVPSSKAQSHTQIVQKANPTPFRQSTSNSRSLFPVEKDSFFPSKSSKKEIKTSPTQIETPTDIPTQVPDSTLKLPKRRETFLTPSDPEIYRNRIEELAQKRKWKDFDRQMHKAIDAFNHPSESERKSEWQEVIHRGSILAVQHEHPKTSPKLRRYVEKLGSMNVPIDRALLQKP